MKIALISVHDDNFKQLADITWHRNKKLYAQTHGYDTFEKHDNFEGLQIGFAKIKFMLEILNKGEHDAIYWSGTDTLITNFFIPLTEFIYPGFHITMAFDFNGPNNDSYLVRNTSEAKNYLQQILDTMPRYVNDHRYEAAFMWDNWEQYKHLYKILPQRMFNAYNYPWYTSKGATTSQDKLGYSGQWYPGDFLFHAVDQPMNVRLEACEQLLNYVIR